MNTQLHAGNQKLDCPNLFIIPNKLWIKLDPTGESIQTGTSLLEYVSPIFCYFLTFSHLKVEFWVGLLFFAPLCKADCPLTVILFVDFLPTCTQISVQQLSRIFYMLPVDFII